MVTKDTSETFQGHLDVFIGGQPAGHTLGGVTIESETETAPIETDDDGLVDSTFLSNTTTVTIRLAQINPATIALAIPGAVVTATGVVVSSVRGNSLRSVAQPMVVTGTNGVECHQWTFEAVAVSAGTEVNFIDDEQTVLEIPFTALPGPDGRFYRYQNFPK